MRRSLRREDAAAAETQAREDYANARTQQEAEAAEAAIKAAVAARAAAQAESEPPRPVEEVFDEDQLPMYFQVDYGRELLLLLCAYGHRWRDCVLFWSARGSARGALLQVTGCTPAPTQWLMQARDMQNHVQPRDIPLRV